LTAFIVAYALACGLAPPGSSSGSSGRASISSYLKVAEGRRRGHHGRGPPHWRDCPGSRRSLATIIAYAVTTAPPAHESASGRLAEASDPIVTEGTAGGRQGAVKAEASGGVYKVPGRGLNGQRHGHERHFGAIRLANTPPAGLRFLNPTCSRRSLSSRLSVGGPRPVDRRDPDRARRDQGNRVKVQDARLTSAVCRIWLTTPTSQVGGLFLFFTRRRRFAAESADRSFRKFVAGEHALIGKDQIAR